MTLLNEYTQEFLDGIKFGLLFQAKHETLAVKLDKLEQKCVKWGLNTKAAKVRKLERIHDRLFVDLEWMIYTRGYDVTGCTAKPIGIEKVKKRASGFIAEINKNNRRFVRLNKIVSTKCLRKTFTRA
jgi:hypothetical protein